MKSMELKGRVAVLSGAASGIGRALAGALARCGCHVALVDVDEAGLAATASAAAPTGVRLTCHVVDVSRRDAVASLPEAIAAAHGRVDLLVNNAGVALGGRFEQVSEADFDWLMEINFHGVVRMTRAFLPMLKASDDARIVNVSSIYGIVSPPGQSAYSASKFAVRGFSNALRHELAGTRLGVTVVHPGGVATAIARNARIAAGVTDEELRAGRARTERALRMPPEKAADIILQAVERRRDRVLVGNDAKFVALVERFAPVRYWRLLGPLVA